MRISQLLLFTAAFLLISGIGNAQSKYSKKADDEFETGGYIEAAKLYQGTVGQVKDIKEKGRMLYRIGQCYQLSTEYNSALEWYEKAITAQYYNTNPEVYFDFGTTLQEMGRWDDAVVQFNKYSAKGGDKSKANEHIKACQEAAAKKLEKIRLVVQNMAELNTPFFDYSLAYSSKKFDEVVFSSSRQGATGGGADPKTGESFMDLFYAEKDKKGKWSTPQPLNNIINTASNEGAATFDNKNFNEIYYTRCEYDKKDRFACDIMIAKRQGKTFTAPVSLGLIDREHDDSTMVGHPTLTSDDKYMVFASDMPGGKGGKDLWYVTYDKKTDKWGGAKNLANVNSKGDEMFPWIADDGTLYFSSNGQGGLGGLDIFKAEKTGDLSYGPPVNVGYPINSSSDDFSFSLEKGNKDSKYSGFFTSNRPGGKGKDDLYYFMEPPLEFSLVGTAYDQNTGTPLPSANVTIKGSDGADYKLTTDGNGGFSLDKDKMKAGVTYTISVEKDKYIGTGDKVSTVGLKESTHFAREYFLKPVVIGVEYRMPLVLYPYDQTILLVNDTVNSADSLSYLYDLLIQNPTFVIQLEAHTDNRGKDDYNLKLSQGRAETCVNYLVSKGIDPARLKPVGKGETEPRKLTTDEGPIKAGSVLTEAYINKLPVNQQEIAHQLNRRTVFRILSTDFVPKK